MRVELLPQKALRIGSTLLVADLHVGFEAAMAEEGNYVPSLLRKMVADLRSLLLAGKFRRLVINGDLKHSFVPVRRERRELRAFFEGIEGLVDEIILVRGNHDVGITWLRELGVEIVDSLELAGWTVLHGHRLEEGERFIIGHEHPAIRLRDEVGASVKVPIFLRGDELIVLPAFSPWAYGNDVTREIVSPFLRKFETDSMRVIVPLENELLDFGELGKLKKTLRALL
ncbi:metallophosphoesterase [Thermococcus sp. AM4]|uniref:metallophosphoesterase n=1 Tax=Thermococcus sp. (strain AM4) TaxID=246969 RepID=UPI000186F932|nr:metallophosphoesterase [Thermococcus sp. AM4]EEB74789.1 metallophosphoesterase, calcineurin superfamily [Thermococcus sp. AM4]